MLYRKGIEKHKLYSLEWGQCSFLEIQKMHFEAHNYGWQKSYENAEAEKVSWKTGHVPRSQQHLRCLWGWALSAAFSKKRNINILPASPEAHIWICNCPNYQLNYLPAYVIRESSYFSLHFCGADSFPGGALDFHCSLGRKCQHRGLGAFLVWLSHLWLCSVTEEALKGNSRFPPGSCSCAGTEIAAFRDVREESCRFLLQDRA